MTLSNTASGAPTIPGITGGFSSVPVSTEPTIDASAVAGTSYGNDATVLTAGAPQAYAASSVLPASAGGLLSGLLSGIKNFLSSIFGRLFGPRTPAAPTQTSGVPANDDAQVAARYGLLSTPANVAAFKATLAREQSEADVLGPGAQNADAVSELQQLLAGWGYAVPATGQFDQATADALVAWKASQGLTENFVFANGQAGVTPFVDARTRQQMIAVLSASPVQSTTAPVTTAPVVTAPAQQTTLPPVTTTPTAPVTTTPTTGLTAEQASIAQQAGILATPANVQLFLQAANALEQEADVLGPDSPQPDAITELQQVLTQFGYPVAVTGRFDQTTVDAVIKFKRANGLTETYKMADGTPGVHPFIDARTKAVMIAKLGG